MVAGTQLMALFATNWFRGKLINFDIPPGA